MTLRPVGIAYAIPPVLAFLLACVGLAVVSESGLVGASSTVTAVAGSAPASNGRVADALREAADATGSTVVRTIADREHPESRRTALVTAAPGSAGRAWLRDGYTDFWPGVATRVRPMTALVDHDPVGTYEVFGAPAGRTAVAAALADVGYETTSATTSFADRIGLGAGPAGTAGLVAAMCSGCVALCLVDTIGSPRRAAVRRTHGRSTIAVLRSELVEARIVAFVVLVGTPAVLLGLWLTGRASWAPTLAASTGLLGAALLAPVVLAHIVGTVLACRLPLTTALRGARPSSTIVVLAHLARVPVLLLLVSAVFDLSGSVAALRSGTAARDLRAAGAAVQLWVTPDPRPVETQQYWDRIGGFAADALRGHGALLAAPAEVSSGRDGTTVPALFVDPEYLRLQDVRAADGSRLTDDAEVAVWLPPRSDLDAEALVAALGAWELRGAGGAAARTAIGTLRSDELYTYPGDTSSRAWLPNAVLVVVRDPASAFTADQLGSWTSTGDVLFRSRAVAERAIRDSALGDEFSAVVDVGQAAAEEARSALLDTGVGAAAVASDVLVAGALAGAAIVVTRRRHGRARFLASASGLHPLRADRALFLAEAGLASVALLCAFGQWGDRAPDGTGRASVLDPVAAGTPTAAALAAAAVLVVACASSTLVVVTARRNDRTRGAGTR
ncbi:MULTISPECIES: hypothetical protein [unclassified Curtobacterium]|uniref:hypothetical protein n=1 Tax=unclassified Curtobacterium TaxID=257496 RepID=UPI000824F024|nr:MULTISPECIES: hypothetical protein [unclassified Curtobacterium]WIA97253.1 hypothetical protein QOL16_02340 [Curtobacterium sp. MCBA15_004]WIB00570.1 hypothetical protein QOL15_02435 [Curtobacterium sp. MCBA15_012]